MDVKILILAVVSLFSRASRDLIRVGWKIEIEPMIDQDAQG